MVYWSMQHGNGPDIIYYAYANKEFTDFENEPKVLFLPKMVNPVSMAILLQRMACSTFSTKLKDMEMALSWR
jgi:hypothetical protein